MAQDLILQILVTIFLFLRKS